MTLMVAKEEEMGRDLEHLQFAEVRTARARERVNYLSKLRDASANGTPERLQAETVLANFEAIHQSMEQFCHRMRKKLIRYQLGIRSGADVMSQRMTPIHIMPMM
ncbi:hypothetical protein CK489_02625 [Bradyrhizobium sp. UFLA03-84]|uniref:hypothetical protein n=1 Tax=Bradyrhizobium sp. UFLA03-84 TaxID=418599 RepID=UPI000BAE1098|nr:hypothetical protein [Bradyrhizobium sp. UFLA03-84]PAY10608.1 hypothetical protein CK489_02625 [Bradyrhizobium sp. UFLA03-84]